jgi:uncharacterized protein YggE
MKKAFIFLLFISLSSSADFKTYQENVINIEGKAVQKIVPNKATIHVGASAINDDADVAMQKCADVFEKMKDLLKKFNISDIDIKSENIAVSENRDYNGGKKSEGYKAIKQYKITWNNLSTLNDFLVQATSVGANELERIEFTHSKYDSLQKAVINLAIDDANSTADQICAKMNIKRGPPMVISTNQPEEFAYENTVRFAWLKEPRFVAGGGLGGSGSGSKLHSLKVLLEIKPGQIEIKNKVYITYEIKKQ